MGYQSQTDKIEANLSDRQKEILELVEEHGFVATEQMVGHFGVTPQTIRRDINELCDHNLLQRFHGGAGRASSTANEPYSDRLQASSDGKQAIGAAVAAAIPDGSSLFLNIGTTTEAVAQALRNHRDLRIVTNNINVANILRENTSFEIMVTGGRIRKRDGGIVGEAATDFVNQYRLDIGVVGISGIDEAGTLLDFDYQEVRTAQAIIANSAHVMLVADHTKFGRRAMIRMGSVDDVQELFTDTPPPESYLTAIKEAGVKLHITGTPQKSDK